MFAIMQPTKKKIYYTFATLFHSIGAGIYLPLFTLNLGFNDIGNDYFASLGIVTGLLAWINIPLESAFIPLIVPYSNLKRSKFTLFYLHWKISLSMMLSFMAIIFIVLIFKLFSFFQMNIVSFDLTPIT